MLSILLYSHGFFDFELAEEEEDVVRDKKRKLVVRSEYKSNTGLVDSSAG